ncbi:MAG: cytochrome c [Rhizomicrobium sp.]
MEELRNEAGFCLTLKTNRRLGGIVIKHWMGAAAWCIALMIASTSVAWAQSSELLDFGVGRPVPTGNVSGGQHIFDAVCFACHSHDLSGGNAPPLTGSAFYKVWQGRDVDALFGVIFSTMPKGEPVLSEQMAHDLVAYIVTYSNRPESLKGDHLGK